MTSVYSKAKNTRINARLVPVVPEKKSTRLTGKPKGKPPGRPKKEISSKDLFSDFDDPWTEPEDTQLPDRYDGWIEPEEIPEPIRYGRPNVIMWAGHQYQRTEPEDVQNELVEQEKIRKQLSDAVTKLRNELNRLKKENEELISINKELQKRRKFLVDSLRKLRSRLSLQQVEEDLPKPEASKPRGRPKKPDSRSTEPVKIVEQPFVVDMDPGFVVDPEV
jgi:hypothetical protein